MSGVLAFASLILFLAVAEAQILDPSSDVCVEAFKRKRETPTQPTYPPVVRPPGCVTDGSLQFGDKCVFNSQCASGICYKTWRMCYEWEKDINPVGQASCPETSSSEDDVDPTTLDCGNSLFPNSYVPCNDGSSGNYTYIPPPTFAPTTTTPIPTYTPIYDASGRRVSEDEFAIQSVCRHNYFRKAANLQLVKWNVDLGQNAQVWAESLRDNNNCTMKHSSGTHRSNVGGFSYAGENLYTRWQSWTMDDYSLPYEGRAAADAWYDEIKDYLYGGEEHGYAACWPGGVGKPMIGHFTQVMWDSVVEIGCGVTICNDEKSLMLSCVYGGGGNSGNRAAFNQASADALYSFDNRLGFCEVPTSATTTTSPTTSVTTTNTNCVEDGTIVNDAEGYVCKRCVDSSQCESNWCVAEWRLCYNGRGCYTSGQAGCPDSSSSTPLGELVDSGSCTNPDFPNKWVDCTDGSNGKETYV